MWDTILGHEANKIFLGNMLQGELKHRPSFFMGLMALVRRNLPMNLPGVFFALMIPPMMTASAAAAAPFAGKVTPTLSM